MIPVTKPFLPPREDYERYLDGIWQRNWLTNNGPLVNELELRLKDYLNINHLLFLGNGTIALQIAIKALGLKGEIITTPFSYVATTSSIVWEGCEPVFVDIDSRTLNLDPNLIEDAITPRTSAILATHVYGNPCDIAAIQEIAQRKGLKVIYDAAHAFGVKYLGQSIFLQGDISTTSFHATKLFHTTEGGAVITKDPDLLKRMAYLRNFGHDGHENFDGIGINGKNSEFHAAMGLCVLNHIDAILQQRKMLSDYYDLRLKSLVVTKPHWVDPENFNYAYYPVIFQSEKQVLKAKANLEANEVFSRRYFYPVLSEMNYVQFKKCPVAEDIAARVLCLPLYHQLSKEEIDFIMRLLIRTQNYG
ncbi:MAG: DegT/DnrJ/EryC1/StrS family aminotransferase [Leptospiraceae bacterium]|nr:DegT/DnrJ/EryC1/StrS family aminotransferase [Leptospiraceae bacterium]